MDQEKAIISTHDEEISRISANNESSEAMITIDESRESTTISIREEDQEDTDDRNSKGSSLDKPIMVKKNVEEEKEEEERFSRIDVKFDEDEDEDEERVCRICHLSAWESCKNLVDLIQIGCGCKGELGFAHSHCGEAWFKLKGSRICEICGENAKNMTGVVDNKFMEEWNENRSTSSDSGLSEQSRGCWSGQPLCNFLMACLVIAFVLPWFFRVNMF